MNINGVEFESGCEKLEVTRNGMFGGPVDTERRYIPGVRWFRIDGHSVSPEEFAKRLTEAIDRYGLNFAS